MSRNSAGSYTLPTGNPVQSGTTITSTWANNTLGDIATELTDSLDRSGKGGMLAPMRVPDGTVTAPTVAFTSETGSGWFRESAGVLKLAILGVWRLLVNATGLQVNGTIQSGAITSTGAVQALGALQSKDSVGGKVYSITAPATLFADLGLILPTALPGSTLPVTLTSGGNLGTQQIVNAQQNFGTPSAATDVAIKSYVDAIATDTPSMGTNVSFFGDVKKRNGAVTINGGITFGATTFASLATFMTLGAGFRPSTNVIVPCYFFDNVSTKQSLAIVQIATNGSVSIVYGYWLTAWAGTDFLPTGSGDSLNLQVSFNIP